MRKRTYRKHWTMRVAAVLLCLVLISTHMMSGLLAKYTTSSRMSDNARVAKFNVTESGSATQSINFAINPLDTQLSENTSRIQYAIEVANYSEVTMSYKISAYNATGNLPLILVMEHHGNEANVTSGVLKPSAKTETLMLNILWEEGNNIFTYNNKVDEIIVTVECEQID